MASSLMFFALAFVDRFLANLHTQTHVLLFGLIVLVLGCCNVFLLLSKRFDGINPWHKLLITLGATVLGLVIFWKTSPREK